jgi:membrane protein CcdC involved in cytochrome C biogenesis
VAVAHTQLFATIAAIVMALMVIVIRLRAAQKPITLRKIIIPPLGMSTGFLMFLAPETRFPLEYAGYAFLVGCILSYPLIASSKMQRIDGKVYLKRSKAFVVILFALLAIRILLHDYVEQYLTVTQTAGVFFVLAFGMILVWRIAMVKQYLRIIKNE